MGTWNALYAMYWIGKRWLCQSLQYDKEQQLNTIGLCGLEQSTRLRRLVLFLHLASSFNVFYMPWVLCCLHNNGFLYILPLFLYCTSFIFCSLSLSCTFPFTVGASDIARIICSHETACTDLGLDRAPIAKASLPLAANDSVADCHRFCTLVLEETETSPCKFTYPNGSRLSLVVLDDDGKILSLISSQCSRLIVCAVCAWYFGNTKWEHLMPLPFSSRCYLTLPPPPSLPSHPYIHLYWPFPLSFL